MCWTNARDAKRLPSECAPACAPAFITLAQDCRDQVGLSNIEGADDFLALCQQLEHGGSTQSVSAGGNCDCHAELTELRSMVTQLQRVVQAGNTMNAGSEHLACSCSLCANGPDDSGRCLPWTEDPLWPTFEQGLRHTAAGSSPVEPCDCTAASQIDAQPFPSRRSDDPPCCRIEWPATATITAIQPADALDIVYDNPTVNIKIGGQVTFVYSGARGFENVVEVKIAAILHFVYMCVGVGVGCMPLIPGAVRVLSHRLTRTGA
eukprot:SAG31_NODE_359_length_17032_cov_11.017894_14_plen_263_part_00